MFLNHLKNYFEGTSLHGLKWDLKKMSNCLLCCIFVGRYITEPGRPHFERLLWVFLCCSGVVLAVFFLKPSDPDLNLIFIIFPQFTFWPPCNTSWHRCGEIHQRPNEHNVRNDRLPHLEHRLSRSHNLPKRKGVSYQQKLKTNLFFPDLNK